MHKPSPHKELYDPYYHYTRGVLYYDKNHFTFVNTSSHKYPLSDPINGSTGRLHTLYTTMQDSGLPGEALG